MDQLRKERIARNQTIFREINESHGNGSFICECGDIGCAAKLEVAVSTYESVRADPQRFLVKSGHVIPGAEEVLVRGEDWVVVRKHDDVSDVVEKHDVRHGTN